MAIQRVRTKPLSTLSREQKVAFVLLLFLGTGGVVFGAQSFGAHLTRPIQEQIASYTGEGFLTEDEREAKELEESKTKDTDGDGLVDYDELYVYKTSPYIADSDSDGYSDKQEVYSGNNPNCPTGKTCGFTVGASVDEQTADSGATSALVTGLGADELLEAGSVTFTSEEDVETFFKQATMEQIRAALIESGVSQEELDQIDDETLEAFFYGALDQAADSGDLDEFVTATE